jgi:SAM-dependent methyltransferase
MLLDHLEGSAETAWLESDDGRSQPALGPEVFFASADDWPAAEREALSFVSGRVLDIGCGAGRHALHLQQAGLAVVAIDISPGAVEVARRRGVKDARQLVAEDVDLTLGRFDGFLLMCGNFGIVGSAERGRELLTRLATVANPGAILVADCVDDVAVRLRLRYRDRVTPWFDWLNLAPDELREIVHGSGWHIERVIGYAEEPAAYAAVLRRDG